jgi:subtilisin family serine protease
MIPVLLSLLTVANASTLVVDFVDNTSTTELHNLVGSNIISADWADESLVDESIAIVEVSNLSEGLAFFESQANVTSVEPRIQYVITGMLVATDEPDLKPNDPEFNKQWHMGEIDAPWAWTNTKGGEGIIVAVLDTGFTKTSDMDPERILKGKSFTGEKLTDMHGHGTHCASTIGEVVDNGISGVGVARHVKVLPVKVLSDAGFGYNDWIAGGIRWATDQGAGVISMSLGGPTPSKVIRDAVKYAVDHNVVVVAAAGNDGCEGCMGYPALYPDVISVGATGPDHKRSYYSSYGADLVLAAPGGNKNFPGGGVWQLTNPGNRTEQFLEWQGTSMATPHVAGAVAVLLSEGIAPKEVTPLLTSTAHGPKSVEVGAGIINLKDAVLKHRGGKSAIADLPVSSPPIKQTTLIALLSVLLVGLVSKTYSFSNKFSVQTSLWTGLWAGALAPLNLLPLKWTGAVPGTFHIFDLPDLMFGPGASGFPLWLSPLIALPAVFTLTPFRRTRTAVLGLLAGMTTYLAADALLQFNPVWFLDSIGSRAWIAISAICTALLMVVVAEFQNKNGEV